MSPTSLIELFLRYIFYGFIDDCGVCLYVCIFLYVSVCVYVCSCLWRLEVLALPGDGLTAVCKTPEVGTGNCSQVPYKSSKQF